MIKNTKLLKDFEIKRLKTEKLNFKKAIKLFEALWVEAENLGVLPLKNPLEGIETDLKIARTINSCLKNF